MSHQTIASIIVISLVGYLCPVLMHVAFVVVLFLIVLTWFFARAARRADEAEFKRRLPALQTAADIKYVRDHRAIFGRDPSLASMGGRPIPEELAREYYLPSNALFAGVEYHSDHS